MTTATICPLSGKLATAECAGDASVHPYVDYFASDDAPTEYCDRHVLNARRSLFGSLVAAVRGRSSEGASAVQPAVATEAAAPAPATASVARAEPEAPKKKRGFWGRVFGGGRD